uniref:Eukaryotic translation initiation factor 3 subunit C N-terminal domain-containing protein n=1 Tax=Parascaris equorum TaxID=6256 RepID=A0A914RKR2_PAREQ
MGGSAEIGLIEKGAADCMCLMPFEELCRVFEKTKAVLARQGMSTPRFYIRILVEIEDFVNEQWEDKESRKTMSKANSKGLTTLRQKIRKYNKDMETEVTAYRAEPDPVGYSSADGEADDDEPVSFVVVFSFFFQLLD